MSQPVVNLSATPLAPVRRWTPARKDELLVAIRRRDVSIEQVCQVHGLSAAEIHSWQRRHRAHGQQGLAVTRLQKLRA